MQGALPDQAPYGLVHSELRRAADRALTAGERGRALENAAAYAFSAVPGCEVRGRRTIDPWQSAEIDLLVGNRKREDGLFYLPEIILVECKSSVHPVPVPDVRDFAFKVKHRDLKLGILIVAAGATGARDRRSAAHHTAAIAAALGTRILLVTTRELMAISTAGEFVELLHEKYFQLAASGTFGADG
ncbi:MAG TPA: restriction endonuclease [Actinocrinis sp.]|nr:restriction endonuclease [Actinocrinis sp.]